MPRFKYSNGTFWVIFKHCGLESSYLWVKRDFHKNGRDLFDLSLARDQLLWWRRDADVRHFPAFSDWIFSDNNVYRHSLCRLQILNKKMFFRFFHWYMYSLSNSKKSSYFGPNSLKIISRIFRVKLFHFFTSQKNTSKIIIKIETF